MNEAMNKFTGTGLSLLAELQNEEKNENLRKKQGKLEKLILSLRLQDRALRQLSNCPEILLQIQMHQ